MSEVGPQTKHMITNKDKKEMSEKMEQEEKFEEKEAVEEAAESMEEMEETAETKPEPENIGTEADKYLEGWKRCQADFENYKKRQADSQKDLLRYSTQNVVMQILPVVDNFHASTDHIPEAQKNDPWVVGIMHIQKQLEQVLSDNGVEEIDVKVGDNFDPAMHEAVEDMACVSCKSKDYKFQNKIKRVVLKGYKMGPARNASHSDAGGDRVIRAARVIVE